MPFSLDAARARLRSGVRPRADGCTRCAWEPALFPSRNAVLTALLVVQRLGIVLLLLFLAAVWLR
jgi:hypothetical protein